MLIDLNSQLAGRYNDQCAGSPVMCIQQVIDYRQQKRRRFSCPCLRTAQQVTTLHDRGDRFNLNWSGLFKSNMGNGFQQLIVKAEFFK